MLYSLAHTGGASAEARARVIDRAAEDLHQEQDHEVRSGLSCERSADRGFYRELALDLGLTTPRARRLCLEVNALAPDVRRAYVGYLFANAGLRALRRSGPRADTARPPA